MLNSDFVKKTVAEVQEWSVRNFGNQDSKIPLAGVLEELGELTHAEIKGLQGIRHSPEEILLQKKDALGDIAIYIFNYCGAQKIPLEEGKYKATLLGLAGPLEIIFRTATQYGFLVYNLVELETKDRYSIADGFQGILSLLEAYCKKHDWELETVIHETWGLVSQRNWQNKGR